jgi:hypothetical protein
MIRTIQKEKNKRKKKRIVIGDHQCWEGNVG